MPALLFGSISTVADTSELQRAAFNQAFEQHGLGWKWERQAYKALLDGNGGQQRIADYADAQGQQVDAAAVHATKSEVFQHLLGSTAVTPRPGVAAAVEDARAAGWKVALVTTTSKENVDALLAAVSQYLPADAFDLVLTLADGDPSKPDPSVYRHALADLGEPAADSVAIEDNPGGVRSAQGADVPVVAFPNENTVELDFGDVPRITTVDFGTLAGASA